MLVIRFEDRVGNGPYANPTLNFKERHANKPLPVDEGLPLISSATKSGFSGKNYAEAWDRAIRWFSARDIADMERLGFLVVEYEVPDDKVWVSGTQCLFDINDAVVVDSEHADS